MLETRVDETETTSRGSVKPVRVRDNKAFEQRIQLLEKKAFLAHRRKPAVILKQVLSGLIPDNKRLMTQLNVDTD